MIAIETEQIDEPLMINWNQENENVSALAINTHPITKLSKRRWMIKLFKVYDLYHDTNDTRASMYCIHVMSCLSIIFAIWECIDIMLWLPNNLYDSAEILTVVMLICYSATKITSLYNICRNRYDYTTIKNELNISTQQTLRVHSSAKLSKCLLLNFLVSSTYIVTILIQPLTLFRSVYWWSSFTTADTDLYAITRDIAFTLGKYYAFVWVQVEISYICLTILVPYIVSLTHLDRNFDNYCKNYNNYNNYNCVGDVGIGNDSDSELNSLNSNGHKEATTLTNKSTELVSITMLMEKYAQLHLDWNKHWNDKETLFLWQVCIFMGAFGFILASWIAIYEILQPLSTASVIFYLSLVIMLALPLGLFVGYAFMLEKTFNILLNKIMKKMQNKYVVLTKVDLKEINALESFYLLVDRNRIIVKVMRFEVTLGNITKLIVAFFVSRFVTLAMNDLV